MLQSDSQIWQSDSSRMSCRTRVYGGEERGWWERGEEEEEEEEREGRGRERRGEREREERRRVERHITKETTKSINLIAIPA